jgi:hypothetical protein
MVSCQPDVPKVPYFQRQRWCPSAGAHSRDRLFFDPCHHSYPTRARAAFDAVRDLFWLSRGRNIMSRRATLMLTGMALLGLAMATLPQLGFAQSSPLIGTWKLNLDKSKYGPGPPPRSNTLNLTQDGQNIRDTNQGTDAQGNPTGGVLMRWAAPSIDRLPELRCSSPYAA